MLAFRFRVIHFLSCVVYSMKTRVIKLSKLRLWLCSYTELECGHLKGEHDLREVGKAKSSETTFVYKSTVRI